MNGLENCALCRRRCCKRPGYCGVGLAPRVFRWGPHFGEEPPVTGERGSGCVFFSRCTMKCLYCQNSPWSWQGNGQDKTIPELTEIFRELAVKDRVENWNLVSPTPYLPFIREAVAPLKRKGSICRSFGIRPATNGLRHLKNIVTCAISLFSICGIHGMKPRSLIPVRPAMSKPPARR